MTMTHEQLGSMSAAELAASLIAGKLDLIQLTAHLSSRKLGESVADLGPLFAHLGPYTSAVVESQMALHQRPEKQKPNAIRRAQGARAITVHPKIAVPSNEGYAAKTQWSLTATRATWRWIAEHIGDITAECDKADAVDPKVIDQEKVDKLVREQAAKAAKA